MFSNVLWSLDKMFLLRMSAWWITVVVQLFSLFFFIIRYLVGVDVTEVVIVAVIVTVTVTVIVIIIATIAVSIVVVVTVAVAFTITASLVVDEFNYFMLFIQIA